MGRVLLGPVLRINHWGYVAGPIFPGLGGTFYEASYVLSCNNNVLFETSLLHLPFVLAWEIAQLVVLLVRNEKTGEAPFCRTLWPCTSTHARTAGTGDQTYVGLMRAKYMETIQMVIYGRVRLIVVGHSVGLLVVQLPKFPLRSSG